MSASSSSKQRKRVFIELTLGDAVSFQHAKSCFDGARKFIQEAAPGMGYGHLTLDELADRPDGEDAQMLVELVANSPDLSVKFGTISFVRPDSLILGRMEFELFYEESPKAAENFRALCTGEKGESKEAKGKPLHYLGTPIHRLESGFCLQGGDITRGDGSGGDSIYRGKFQDDKGGLKLTHTRGVLSMANAGRKNTNTSQFFIVLADALPKLDAKHVVFGKITRESDEVLERVATYATSTGKPSESMFISDCGEA